MNEWTAHILLKIVLPLIISIVIYLFIGIVEIHTYPDCKYQYPLYDYPFKSGDLILFSYPSTLRIFTRGKINHVGIVYIDPIDKHVYLWEMMGRGKGGVRLVPIQDWGKDFKKCKMYVRPLLIPIHSFELEQIMKEQKNRQFNWNVYIPIIHRNFISMIHPEWGQDSNCKHCSTFVYEIYKRLNLTTPFSKESCIFPTDFSHNDYINFDFLGEMVHLT